MCSDSTASRNLSDMSVGQAAWADILRCERVMLQLAPERVAGNDDGNDITDDYSDEKT